MKKCEVLDKCIMEVDKKRCLLKPVAFNASINNKFQRYYNIFLKKRKVQNKIYYIRRKEYV